MKTVLQILPVVPTPRSAGCSSRPSTSSSSDRCCATFPDATVVVTHRDPVAVVQSTITMACYGARTPTARPGPSGTATTGRSASAAARRLVARPAPAAGRIAPWTSSSTSTWRTSSARSSGSTTAPALRSPTRRGPRSRATCTPIPRGKEGRVVYDLRRRFRHHARRGARPLRRLPRPLPRSDRGGMNIRDQVDQLIDTRPGKELLRPVYDDPAHPVTDVIYRSGGPHRRLPAAHRRAAGSSSTPAWASRRRTTSGSSTPSGPARRTTSSPPRRTSTTSAGSICSRRRARVYIAQAEQPACQADDARIRAPAHAHRRYLVRHARHRRAPHRHREPGRVDAPGRAGARPDVRPAARARRRRPATWSSYAAVGETIDSCDRLAPRAPHRADQQPLRARSSRISRTSTRCAATATASSSPTWRASARVRALRPEMLVTGRHDPIVGAELIDACLARLYGAVDYVHQRGPRGVQRRRPTSGRSCDEIELPAELRVGQGYGKVPWAVRTLWESYVGWFKLRVDHGALSRQRRSRARRPGGGRSASRPP